MKRNLVVSGCVVAAIATSAWAWQVTGGNGTEHTNHSTCNLEDTLATCTLCCNHFTAPGSPANNGCLNACTNVMTPIDPVDEN